MATYNRYLTMLLFMLAACPANAIAQTRGGTIDVAVPGEPPTLDPMASSATGVYTITQNYFETLYSLNSKMEPVPLLAAAMPELSDNGKVYTIKLRDDVKFHDGQTMRAVDVVASLKRWLSVASRGKTVAPKVVSIEEVDSHTVRLTLTQAYSPLTTLLAFNGTPAVIMPATDVAFPMTKFVGTGPYMLKEYKPDQYIQLVRFEGYSSPKAPADGCSGARAQYLDELRIRPVPDVSTRVEGILAGQFQYADQMPLESVGRLDSSTTKPVLYDYGTQALYLNAGAGPMANVKMRQAVLASLNMEDMLLAGFGDNKFFKLDGALFQETSRWHTEAGVKGHYNQANIERTRKLLAEANYDGRPIRFMTSSQYDPMFKISQVAAEYMRAAGFKVDLQVLDWASLSQRRGDPKAWDIFSTFVQHLAHPALISALASNFVTRWENKENEDLLLRIYAEDDKAKQEAMFARVQELVMTEVPFIKIGDFTNLAGRSTKLQGVVPNANPCFWNAWLQK